MYCSNCGKEINNQAIICPNCGKEINKKNSVVPKQNHNQVEAIDHDNFLWGLLGIFFPIVGLILFLVWKDTKPKTSRTIGIGALANVIALLLLGTFKLKLRIVYKLFEYFTFLY